MQCRQPRQNFFGQIQSFPLEVPIPSKKMENFSYKGCFCSQYRQTCQKLYAINLIYYHWSPKTIKKICYILFSIKMFLSIRRMQSKKRCIMFSQVKTSLLTKRMQLWRLCRKHFAKSPKKQWSNVETTFCCVRNWWKKKMNFSKKNLLSPKINNVDVKCKFDILTENFSKKCASFLFKFRRWYKKSFSFSKNYFRAKFSFGWEEDILDNTAEFFSLSISAYFTECLKW